VSDHAIVLVGCELVHAAIVGVIHNVGNGIRATAYARVFSGRTSVGRLGLEGSIGDVVAKTGATTFEGMVKSKPMTSLMGEGHTPVIRGQRSTVHSGPLIHHTIAVAARTGAGEGGPTQQPTRKLGEEDVEGVFIATTVGGLEIDRI